jgi:hypothetical protein
MTLFLGGTVNPQGLEVAAGFSFFAACLALATSARGPSTAAMVQAAVSGALLVNVRTSSPLWAVAIVAAALLVARPGRWREVVRHAAARWVAVVAAVAGAAAVAWVAFHGAIVTGGGLYPEYASPLRTIVAVVEQWSAYLLLSLALPGRRRGRTGLALLVLAVAAAPVVLQVPTASDVGLIWQGRYALPLAVGVPLVSAQLLGTDRPDVLWRWYRTLRIVVPVILVGHVAAFLAASHRYAEGSTGELVTLTPRWSSPIGYLPGVAAYAVLAAALAALVWRTVARAAADHAAIGTASSS